MPYGELCQEDYTTFKQSSSFKMNIITLLYNGFFACRIKQKKMLTIRLIIFIFYYYVGTVIS